MTAAMIPPFSASVAEVSDDLALVSVTGELDLFVQPDLRDSMAAADRLGAHTVVVDLSGVSFLDSTICGMLVGEAKRLRGAGGELVLVTNGPPASRVLEVSGIDRVIRTYPTLHGALEPLLVPEPIR